jgi:hypothetical protein
MANKATTIRLTSVDKQMIAELKDRLGIRSTTELIRMALRVLDRGGIVHNSALDSAATPTERSGSRPDAE